MADTIAALWFAHVLADYVFQTKAMVARKHTTRGLGLHIGIVALTSWGAIGFAAPMLVITLAWVHAAVDQAKLSLMRPGARAYVADQALHLITIVVLAYIAPHAWTDGIWAERAPAAIPALMALTAGMIFATRGGGFAVAHLVGPLLARDWSLRKQAAQGLSGAGATIGQLERALCFLAIVTGHPAGVAMLVAAKSVLRFSDAQKSRKLAEYVLIGTLASVGWATVTGLCTRFLIQAAWPEPFTNLLIP